MSDSVNARLSSAAGDMPRPGFSRDHRHRLGAGSYLELLEDLLHVLVDGRYRHAEVRRDLLVGATVTQLGEDFLLPPAQRSLPGQWRGLAPRLDVQKVPEAVLAEIWRRQAANRGDHVGDRKILGQIAACAG